ncbi:AT-rich interactive domain-containing protein 3B-like isoform X1 [Oncorhynchus masou masou]|uniref:AT-rich interactive domain-containing protein 3B-like isoform X1 n=1 Tax=Oncorhynchus masou masou TaxID=90313 RepID=UPI003183FB8F
MENSKSQMPNLSQEVGGGLGLGSPVGVRLEAVMEQLQRQQEAKLEMDRQEKHLRQAQMMFIKHVTATRNTGAPLDSAFLGKRVEGTGTGRTPRMSQQQTEAGGSNTNTQSGVHGENGEEGLGGEGSEEDDEEEERTAYEEENSEDEDDGGHMTRMSPLQQDTSLSFPLYSTSPSAAATPSAASLPMNLKKESEEKDQSTTEQHSFTSSNGFGDWSFDDGPFKQKGSVGWAEENEGGKTRGEPSRDFAKLYELDSDPNRKEFLDELFVFMQKRGTPVNRIPIMAKQILDLYMLYKLVTEKGGLVEVINKKIWREITRGLNLPTSITSAAFTLRTQYMKYLYPYECEKKGLSSPGELQAAIDGNRREGRRHSNSLYHFSPSTTPGHPHHSLLSPPKMPHHSLLSPSQDAPPLPPLPSQDAPPLPPLPPQDAPPLLSRSQRPAHLPQPISEKIHSSLLLFPLRGDFNPNASKPCTHGPCSLPGATATACPGRHLGAPSREAGEGCWRRRGSRHEDGSFGHGGTAETDATGVPTEPSGYGLSLQPRHEATQTQQQQKREYH